MTWTPPTVKWKTQASESPTCTGGKCVARERFDTLATPRVIEIVGFERRCTGHTDGLAFPNDRIQGFDGEWRMIAEHLAWESAWYSYVVWHEILERAARGEFDPAGVAKAQAHQKARAKEHADKVGLPNLARADTDDGPWKPDAQPEPSSEARDGLARAYGWFMRDDALYQRVLQNAETEGADRAQVAWWFEGVGDDRQLHVDTGGQLTNPQRNTVESQAELSFGPGRLVWEG